MSAQVIEQLLKVTVVAFLSSAWTGAALGQQPSSPNPAERRAVFQQAHTETVPVVIFIPGIMGSELYKGDKSLWGDAGFEPLDKDLAYKPDVKLRTKILEDFKFHAIALKPVYGETVSRIRAQALARQSRAFEFPYDWRQSNQTSAGDLTEFVCRKSPEFLGQPVVFYAHSMGGLVLKNWLLREYPKAVCANGKSVQSMLGRIERVIFVATPHLGAPIAVEALAHHYNVAGRGDGTFRDWLRTRIGKRFSASLNAFGGTFPSFYELLPAPDECLTVKRATAELLRKAASVMEADSLTPISNIFHFEMWKNYQWPKNLYNGDTSLKAEFISNQLDATLANAKRVSCDLIAHNWQTPKLPTTRVFSESNKQTPCKITILEPSRVLEIPKITVLDEGLCPGDGTVPDYSASENGNRHSVLINLPGDHQELASVAVSELGKVFIEAINKREERIRELSAQRFAASVPVVPVSSATITAESDAARKATLSQVRSTTISANEAIVGQRNAERPEGVKSVERQIYREARSLTGKKEYIHKIRQTDAYLIAADLAGLNQRSRAWALNNAADTSLQIQEYQKAKYLAVLALATADLIDVRGRPKIAAEIRKLRSKAALTGAQANKKLGDLNEARRLRDLAIRYGNPKGSRLVI